MDGMFCPICRGECRGEKCMLFDGEGQQCMVVSVLCSFIDGDALAVQVGGEVEISGAINTYEQNC